MKVLYTADGTINNAMGARATAAAAGSLKPRSARVMARLATAQRSSQANLSCRILAAADMARPSSATRAAFWTICARAGLPPSVRGRCMATTGDAADDTLAVDAAATQSLQSQMRAAASGPDLASEA